MEHLNPFGLPDGKRFACSGESPRFEYIFA
jgi:hypothetical protein